MWTILLTWILLMQAVLITHNSTKSALIGRVQGLIDLYGLLGLGTGMWTVDGGRRPGRESLAAAGRCHWPSSW
jgi:hypothetical protein